MKHIYELIPPLKEYIWGGKRLKNYKKTNLENISESWEVSFLPNDESKINYGDKLITISEFFKLKEFSSFYNKKLNDILIKLIDSNSSLSIQVHPSDEYALEHEGSLGKTEMRIILDCEKDSYLNLGFNQNINKKTFPSLIKDDNFLNYLNKVYVKPGDTFLINSGTIHAIGKGITLIEIQESSKLTYRVYDFNRVDKNGNKRELHINKAMDVLNFDKYEPFNMIDCEDIATKYFNVVKEQNTEVKTIEIRQTSFITILDGQGCLENTFVEKFKTYLLLPGKLTISGTFKYVLTTY